MERQCDVPGSSLYWSRNAKLKGKTSEQKAGENAAPGTDKPTGSKTVEPKASPGHADDLTASLSPKVSRSRNHPAHRLSAQRSGNVYRFSRGEERAKHEAAAQEDKSPHEDKTPAAFDREYPADQSDEETSGQMDRETDASPEPASESVVADTKPVQPAAAAWADHPITQALAGLLEPNSGLNPAQVIADSLLPPMMRGRKPSPQMGHVPPAELRDTPSSVPAEYTAREEQPHDIAKEIPVNHVADRAVRPQPSDQSTEAGEFAAKAIDARDTFWDFWLGHQDQMRSQCIRLMAGNVADAEDALSSAMLRASQKFPNYSDSIINGKAWLRKLVYNVCMDHYRQGKQTEYRALDQESDIPISGAMFTGQQQSPEEIALSQEQIRELDSCISALSNNLRVPLFLRCVEGWSYPDIAEELDLRADTVRKRIQLARDHLRRSNIR